MIIFWKIILTILLTMLITCMVGAIGSMNDSPKCNKLCKIAFYTLAGEGFVIIVMAILHLWSII